MLALRRDDLVPLPHQDPGAERKDPRLAARGAALNHVARLQALLDADPWRASVLGQIAALGLPDCWVGAGFVRNAVWDHQHDRAPTPPAGDVDVIWFAPDRTDPAEDRRLEAALRRGAPSVDWSVKNQARMHGRNDDPPYASATAAMRGWPETATAVAVRLTPGGYDVAAPHGLDDLFDLILRPTPRFAGDKRPIFVDRVQTKGWLQTWPRLCLAEPARPSVSWRS